jgi:K+-transporting ATPase ATPase C chain
MEQEHEVRTVEMKMATQNAPSTTMDQPVEVDVEPLRGSLLRQMRIGFTILIVFTLLTGVIYPLVITGIAQVVFNDKANGSMIERDGQTVGSELVGQDFFGQVGYFWGRPSAGVDGYNGGVSSGSNLGPTNPVLIDRINESVAAIQAAHPERAGQPIPVDLVTASGSGLDPHISPASAEYQVPRIARERGISEEQVRDLVDEYTDGRTLGVLGEPRVNVLQLNLALDELAPLAGR